MSFNRTKQKRDSNLAFDLVRYKIHKRTFSQVCAIMSEISDSVSTELKMFLRQQHGIVFDTRTDDPMLYFLVTEPAVNQMFKDNGVTPTLLQEIGVAIVVSDVSEQDAVDRFRAWSEAE